MQLHYCAPALVTKAVAASSPPHHGTPAVPCNAASAGPSRCPGPAHWGGGAGSRAGRCDCPSDFFPWVRSWFWSPCQTSTCWIICQRSWMASFRFWATTAKRFGKCEWRAGGTAAPPGPSVRAQPTPADGRQPQGRTFPLLSPARVPPAAES